jgi:hypothetical protein
MRYTSEAYAEAIRSVTEADRNTLKQVVLNILHTVQNSDDNCDIAVGVLDDLDGYGFLPDEEEENDE